MEDWFTEVVEHIPDALNDQARAFTRKNDGDIDSQRRAGGDDVLKEGEGGGAGHAAGEGNLKEPLLP